MSTAKHRKFRPALDRLEPLCLLSAGLHPRTALVHQENIVDLKPTQVGRDTLRAISQSTLKFGRGTITLNALTADDVTRTVRGAATVSYRISLFTKVTSNIVFQTSLDDPKPGDVKVNLD